MRSFYLFGSTFQGERGCSLFKPFDSSPTAEMCVFVRAARWLLLLRVPSVCRAVILLVKFRMAVGGDHPGKQCISGPDHLLTPEVLASRGSGRGRG